MVSSQEIRGKVHLCLAQITSGGGGSEFWDHIMLCCCLEGDHGMGSTDWFLKKGNEN